MLLLFFLLLVVFVCVPGVRCFDCRFMFCVFLCFVLWFLGCACCRLICCCFSWWGKGKGMRGGAEEEDALIDDFRALTGRCENIIIYIYM